MNKRTNVLELNDWADEFLKKLPREEQIKWLTEKLVAAGADNKVGVDLLEGLAMVFDDDIAFRKHLRNHVYDQLAQLSMQDLVGVSKSLVSAIVKKILEGWDWRWECGEYGTHERFSEYERKITNVDANDCFQFICNIWVRGYVQMKKLLMEAFHEHINSHRYESGGKWLWKAEDLSEWILTARVPTDIFIILANARTRIGGECLIYYETSLSQAFQTQARSAEAIAIAISHLETIRQAEELARELLMKISPTNRYGDPNPKLEVTNFLGEVGWRLQSENDICFSVIFIRSKDPDKARKNSEVYPRIIAQMQAIRDGFLENVKNPPSMFFEASEEDMAKKLVADGFFYNERY